MRCSYFLFQFTAIVFGQIYEEIVLDQLENQVKISLIFVNPSLILLSYLKQPKALISLGRENEESFLGDFIFGFGT